MRPAPFLDSRLLALLVALVMAAAACSSEDGEATATDDDSETTSDGDGDGDGDGTEDSQTTGEEAGNTDSDDAGTDTSDTGASDTDADGADGSAAGGPADPDLVMRFSDALLSDPGPLSITEADTTCAAEMVGAGLAPEIFQNVVTNLEETNELSGAPDDLSDADVLAIASGMASCLDLTPLTAEIEAEDTTGLMGCVHDAVGDDQFEIRMLEQLITDGEPDSEVSPALLLDGIEHCPAETRAAVAQAALDSPEVVECIEGLTDDDLVTIAVTANASDVDALLAAACP